MAGAQEAELSQPDAAPAGQAVPAEGAEADGSAADLKEAAGDMDTPAGPGAPATSPIKVLGEGATVVYLVDHGGTWSMHAENVPADVIFRLWRGAGGPEVRTKLVLDHPFTMSVHRLGTEKIVARMLDGFNYTLQYKDGRLTSINVSSSIPTRMYKTPRLVEPRSKWTEAELAMMPGVGDSSARAPGGRDAASVPAAVTPPPEPADPPVPPPTRPPPMHAPSVLPGSTKTWPSGKEVPSRPKPPAGSGGMRSRGADNARKPPAVDEVPAGEKAPRSTPKQRLPRRGGP